jgi:glycerophosphoryl diester phosphodiesterase
MSSPPSPLVLGHRGGRGEGWPPENTLGAFDRARAEGAAGVELDVRTCADGDLVVFHDTTLARLTAGKDARLVAGVPRAELARLGAPTLEEALAWAAPLAMTVNVELKHDVPSRPRLARAAAKALRGARADVLLSSFDPLLLVAMAALLPRVPRALLTNARQGRYGHAMHALARPGLLQALHLQRTETSPEAIARYRRRGLRVGVWTVNDPREAKDLARLGVDTLITDCPAVVVAALV